MDRKRYDHLGEDEFLPQIQIKGERDSRLAHDTDEENDLIAHMKTFGLGLSEEYARRRLPEVFKVPGDGSNDIGQDAAVDDDDYAALVEEAMELEGLSAGRSKDEETVRSHLGEPLRRF
jgi:hypothetical protein